MKPLTWSIRREAMVALTQDPETVPGTDSGAVSAQPGPDMVCVQVRLCLDQPGGALAALTLRRLGRGLTGDMVWRLPEHVSPGGSYCIPRECQSELERAVGAESATRVTDSVEQLLAQTPQVQPRGDLGYRDLRELQHSTPWCPAGMLADARVQLGPWAVLVELDTWDPDEVSLELVLWRGRHQFSVQAPSVEDLWRGLQKGVQSLTENGCPSRDRTAHVLGRGLAVPLVAALTECYGTLARYGYDRAEVRWARDRVANGGADLASGLQYLETTLGLMDVPRLESAVSRVARETDERMRGSALVVAETRRLLTEALRWGDQWDRAEECSESEDE